MIPFIRFIRACLFLIEALTYNPPRTIQENQSEFDRDTETEKPLFL